MKILTSVNEIELQKDSSIVKFCYQADFSLDPVLRRLDTILNGTVKRIFESGEFDGGLNQTVILHVGSDLLTDRVILAGLGPKKSVVGDSYRQAAGTVSRLKAAISSKSIAFYLNYGEDNNIISAIIEGFILGGSKIDKFKSGQQKPQHPDSVIFCTHTKNEQRGFDKGIKVGQIVAEGVLIGRELAADPGNLLTPERFAQQAKSFAKKYNFEVDVLNESKIKSQKMGALLSVAQGSSNPPRMVVANYLGGTKGRRPIVLVGKGITFDSGGISLKEPLKMIDMKGDMTGGGIVLATVLTAARLGLKQNIIGIIPLAENMPSGTATKPGDIITSRKGLTIEVINTDAEGRLVLCDALDYANEFDPVAVIDIATLTGASKYILGEAGIPYIGNNSRLNRLVEEASERCGERTWQLPIWDDYRQAMKSDIADLKNSDGPVAGTVKAAAFLEYFIGKWPWLHLDIAQVDVEKKGRPYVPKGQTANGMRLLVELISNWKRV